MRADNQEFERSKLTVMKKLVRVFRQKVNSTQTRGATQAPGDTDAPDATHAQCASTSLAELDGSDTSGLAEMTPPVPALFLLNRGSTDAEAKFIISSIAAGDFKIKQIEQELLKPNAGCDGQIDIHKEFIPLHSALLSKFRRLPRVVFFLCFMEKPEEKPLS